MSRIAWVAAALSLALALPGSKSARAQGLDGERFAPAAGAAGGLIVERPVVPAHLGYGLGLFLHFSDDSVILRDRDSGETVGKPLDHAFSADVLASIGLFDHFELALHLPARLVYKGDDATVDGAAIAAATGIGDIRLVPKLSFGWSGDATSGSAFGIAAPVSFPTGRPEALRGAGKLTVEPRFLAMFYGARWFFNASAGFRFRQKEGPTSPGHELTLGAAFTYTPETEDDVLDIQVEAIAGWLPQDETDHALSAVPLEALAALVYKPAPRWSIYGGGGAGITNALGIPDFRVLAGVRYAVGVPGRGGQKDTDTDGVPDSRDRCDRDPEDMDGYQDDDGCPEEDNDRDGVPDDDDECPEDAEEPGGDRDGCPDRPKVIVRKGRMVIYGKILFPVESAEMLPRSEPLIDEMARALKEHPRIRKVEIQGHTDSSGSAEFNRKLSQDRADAVKRSLVRRGVSQNRLVARGYGETKPIAPNVTRAGRAKNRRVDFTIVDE